MGDHETTQQGGARCPNAPCRSTETARVPKSQSLVVTKSDVLILSQILRTFYPNSPMYPNEGRGEVIVRLLTDGRRRLQDSGWFRRLLEIRAYWRGMRHTDRNKQKNHGKTMNTLTSSRSHILTRSRYHALATFLLIVAGVTTKADVPFTTTGWLIARPLPGITVSNSSGQVYVKGNAHVVRFQANDLRVSGRLEAWMDLAYQSDGSAIFSGPAYLEVGTWDSAGTNFIPSGMVWTLNYSGVIQTDGSTQYRLAGYGIGGNIEGLRVSGTATRSNSDPSTPYLGSGTIKPAPVNTRVVVDDFANNQFTWPAHGVGPNGGFTGTFFASETNQQLTLGGTWPHISSTPIEAVAWADLIQPWTVSAGKTIEARVDVIALSQTAAGAELALWHTADSAQAYFVLVGRNSIALAKEEGNDFAIFRAVRASIKDTHIVLSLSLTPVGGNVVLTGKVLDKDNGAAIAQVVATDTSGSDPTLSASELAAVTGGRVWSGGIRTDPVGLPFTSGVCPLISVHQESDVAPVTVFATFDNLELRTYEVSQIGYERALRLFWPDTGMNFLVEGASSPEGPWLPVQSSEIPGMHYFTIPMGAQQEFFQLQQAP